MLRHDIPEENRENYAMTIRLGIVMDPIGSINVKKDSSLAMLLAAQKLGWELSYMEMGDLYLQDEQAMARQRALEVRDDAQDWYSLGPEKMGALADLDVILMRKDPPFDMEYIYITYLLERAEAAGCLVVNRPRALRDTNEKLATTAFPQCCTPMVVSRKKSDHLDFLAHTGDVIVKPLDGMGGASIFRITKGDPNTQVILETLTDNEQRFIMSQQFIPEIRDGDKRILLIDGEPVDYALARVPAKGETRGNLAAGGRGVGVALSERDRWICAEVGPSLRDQGLMFVGLDVIGDYLTEINVTSPTCIRELDALYGLDIGLQLMQSIEARLAKRG